MHPQLSGTIVRPSCIGNAPCFHALQQPDHKERPNDRRITQHFGKAPAFFRWYKLSPRNTFLIGTATQSAPIIGLRTNAYPIPESRRRYIEAEPRVTDLNVRPDLLRPIARHSSANR